MSCTICLSQSKRNKIETTCLSLIITIIVIPDYSNQCWLENASSFLFDIEFIWIYWRFSKSFLWKFLKFTQKPNNKHTNNPVTFGMSFKSKQCHFGFMLSVLKMIVNVNWKSGVLKLFLNKTINKHPFHKDTCIAEFHFFNPVRRSPLQTM